MTLIRQFDEICETGTALAGYTAGLCGEWDPERFSTLAKLTGTGVGRMTVANQRHTDVILTRKAGDGGYGIIREHGEGFFDGMITREAGLMLCVYTADCVPVVLLDPVNKAVGIAHSGWAGSAKKIAGKTIKKMEEEYGRDPQRVICCMGPYNHSCCYEVGEDVREVFGASFSKEECERLFKKKENEEKYLLDLGEAVSISLCQEGVKRENIHDSGHCTFHTDEYSSWRRSHDKKHRIITYIMVTVHSLSGCERNGFCQLNCLRQ